MTQLDILNSKWLDEDWFNCNVLHKPTNTIHNVTIRYHIMQDEKLLLDVLFGH